MKLIVQDFSFETQRQMRNLESLGFGGADNAIHPVSSEVVLSMTCLTVAPFTATDLAVLAGIADAGRLCDIRLVPWEESKPKRDSRAITSMLTAIMANTPNLGRRNGIYRLIRRA